MIYRACRKPGLILPCRDVWAPASDDFFNIIWFLKQAKYCQLSYLGLWTFFLFCLVHHSKSAPWTRTGPADWHKISFVPAVNARSLHMYRLHEACKWCVCSISVSAKCLTPYARRSKSKNNSKRAQVQLIEEEDDSKNYSTIFNFNFHNWSILLE